MAGWHSRLHWHALTSTSIINCTLCVHAYIHTHNVMHDTNWIHWHTCRIPKHRQLHALCTYIHIYIHTMSYMIQTGNIRIRAGSTSITNCSCNVGFYKEPTGSGKCKSCPAGAVTLFTGMHSTYFDSWSQKHVWLWHTHVCITACTGSIIIDECVCESNTWLDTGNLACTSCEDSTSNEGTVHGLNNE